MNTLVLPEKPSGWAIQNTRIQHGWSTAGGLRDALPPPASHLGQVEGGRAGRRAVQRLQRAPHNHRSWGGMQQRHANLSSCRWVRWANLLQAAAAAVGGNEQEGAAVHRTAAEISSHVAVPFARLHAAFRGLSRLGDHGCGFKGMLDNSKRMLIAGFNSAILTMAI